MTMDRPTRFFAGPHEYKIYWDESSWSHRPSEHAHVALSNHFLGGIWIQPGSSESQQKDSLLHEILHSLFALSGNVQNYTTLDDVEEHLVTQLAPWTLATLADSRNRPVWKYLGVRA